MNKSKNSDSCEGAEPQKKVALMQPTFMPWLGYFGLMDDADEFVYLDDFQFVRRSFHQRNRLFTNADTPSFISISVAHAGSQDTPLNAALLQQDPKWVRKTLASLQHNYKFSDCFDDIYAFFEDWLNKDFGTLAEFNIYGIEFVRKLLGIDTKTSLSSLHNIQGQRSERILALLRAFEANTYLSARGSFEYMEEDNIFKNDDIAFRFQNFTPAPYTQRQAPEFIPYLSVFDSLLQQGADATLHTIRQSSGQYFSAEDLRHG